MEVGSAVEFGVAYPFAGGAVEIEGAAAGAEFCLDGFLSFAVAEDGGAPGLGVLESLFGLGELVLGLGVAGGDVFVYGDECHGDHYAEHDCDEFFFSWG